MVDFIQLYLEQLMSVSILMNFLMVWYLYQNKKRHEKELILLRQQLQDSSKNREKVTDLLFSLESSAGELKELIVTYVSIDILANEFHQHYNAVMQYGAKLSRYPELLGRVKDFCHCCGVLVNIRQDCGDERVARDDVYAAYEMLMNNLNAVRKNA